MLSFGCNHTSLIYNRLTHLISLIILKCFTKLIQLSALFALYTLSSTLQHVESLDVQGFILWSVHLKRVLQKKWSSKSDLVTNESRHAGYTLTETMFHEFQRIIVNFLGCFVISQLSIWRYFCQISRDGVNFTKSATTGSLLFLALALRLGWDRPSSALL